MAKKRTTASSRYRNRTGNRKARTAADGSPAPPAPNTPSPASLNDEEVELALVTGERQAELEQFFGVDDYAELRELSLQSRQVRLRAAPRVIIIPGILGSKLGSRRKLLPTWDALWLDLTEIIRGNLVELNLENGRDVEAFGVILTSYLKLKLRLRIQGFRPDFYPYDWRQSIDKLGREFAKHLQSIDEKVSVVAHSMGGLVTRAAFSKLGEESEKHIDKLIMLGTPNHGSYIPVQVFRGTSATLKKLSKLAPANQTTEVLVDEAFATIDGLIQMMPFGGTSSGVDFYKKEAWPNDSFHPRTERLRGGPRVQRFLEKVRREDLERSYLIAGINRETAIDASFENGEYTYTYSREGDGTVPLVSATLDGIKATYFIDEQHGALPNNRTVAKAVADILKRGTTDELPTEWSPPRSLETLKRTDSDLRSVPVSIEPGREPGMDEERHLLEEFLAPSADSRSPVREVETLQPLSLSRQPVVIGRRRQHRLDVTLAQGDITDVNAQAIILGIYEGVQPSGASRALDQALGGEISRLISRRMFSASAGEVFILPVSRRRISADFVVFVGLGFYDSYSDEILKIAARNTARVLLSAQINDFATVMMGSASATSVKASLQSMLEGFSKGMLEAGPKEAIRSVTIVEFELNRFQQMQRSVIDLAVNELLDGIEVTVDSIELPPTILRSRPALRLGDEIDPLYLIVRQSPNSPEGDDEDDRQTLQASLLTSGGKATVISEGKEYLLKELDTLLKGIDESLATGGLDQFGRELGDLVLPDSVKRLLWQYRNRKLPLVVLHDSGASRIPWETLRIEGSEAGSASAYRPALDGGLGRKFMTDVPVSKWLEERLTANQLNLLLIVDPTSDLAGARHEGKRIQALIEKKTSITYQRIYQDEATHSRLLDEISSGEYDIIHYAGHAFFDPVRRSRSGILCADQRVLSGEDLAGIGKLPTLMVFNACESGRIRKISTNATGMAAREGTERVLRNVSLSEAFLRGGVSNYIGTYWPVGDLSAQLFAENFYDKLLNGETIGSALDAGRIAVEQSGSGDWADYMHYGDRGFRLKIPGES